MAKHVIVATIQEAYVSVAPLSVASIHALNNYRYLLTAFIHQNNLPSKVPWAAKINNSVFFLKIKNPLSLNSHHFSPRFA